ncbi:MAG: prepilin peptidase [Candidatus Diapherotrites archaeon]
MPISFPIFFFIISIIALIIATFTDLRERIVSNKLTFSLIFGGLILQGIRSLLANDPSIIIVTGAVTFATAVGSLLLYKAGGWAGGDVKLMTGLATINTVNHGVLRDLIGLESLSLLGITFNFASVSEPIFPFSLFVFSIISMVPWVTAITLKRMIDRREMIKKMNLKGVVVALVKRKINGIVITTAAIVGTATLLIFLGVPEIFHLPIVTVIGLLGLKKISYLLQKFLAAILLAFALYLSVPSAIFSFAVVFVIILTITLTIEIVVHHRPKKALARLLGMEKDVRDLEEGEIPLKTIVEKGGKIEILEGASIGTLIKQLMDNNLDALNQAIKPGARVVASSSSAGGLTGEQLKEIKELANKGLIPKKIEVKGTTAFVPGILIGYLLLQLIGDVLWVLFPFFKI